MVFTEEYEILNSALNIDSFVGMNSGAGFIGLYGELFDEKNLRRLYIIKGAAGTGKSTLMRKISEKCTSEGHSVKAYACSSDPSSLDAVVINSEVAVIDGTSPHAYDMQYPGAVSEIVDVTRFWDVDVLTQKRDELIHLAQSKAASFSDAYRALASCRLLSNERLGLVNKCIDHTKMATAVARLTRSLNKNASSGRAVMRSYRSVGMKGKVKLDTLETSADTVIAVSDVYGSAYVFMKQLLKELTESSHDLIYSVDPVNEELVCDVFLCKEKILVSVDVTREPDRVINMHRFINPRSLSHHRGALRLSKKCTTVILDEAMSSFSSVAQSHFRLEEIYSSAMDFDVLDRYTTELGDKILLGLANKQP